MESNVECVIPILDQCGIDYKQETSGEVKICCPFHEERTPSFHIYNDNHCFCFGCNKFCWHDELVAKIANCSIIEAKKKLGTFDPSVNYGSEEKWTSKFKLPNIEFADPVKDYSAQFAKLPSEVPPEMNDFLKSKGLNGFAYDLGKWRWHPKGTFKCWPKQEGICIPYFGPNGEIATFRLRMYDRMRGKFTHPLAPKGVPLQASHMVFDHTQPVFFCEGECLTPDTEILTPAGWVRFDEYDGKSKVCQWNDGTLSFVTPLAFVKKPHINGRIYNFQTRGFSMATTPKHRLPMVPVYKAKKDLVVKTAETIGSGGGYRVPRTGELNGKGLPLTDAEIRLAVAISADFSERKYSWYGNFAKERKINRVRQLLNKCGIKYAEYTPDKQGRVGFQIWEKVWWMRKNFDHSWIGKMSLRQRQVFLEEIPLWDGNYVPNRQQSEYSTVIYENAVFVQTLAHTSDMCSTIIERRTKNNFSANAHWYKVSILWNKKYTDWAAAVRKLDITTYTGEVYCVTVPSSFFLIRHNGHISVTGNTDSLSLRSTGRNVICLPGVGAKKQLHSAIMTCFEWGVPMLVFCGDNDEAGQNFNKYAVEAAMMLGLGKYVPQLRTLHLPDEYNALPSGGFKRKDINDFLVEGRLTEIMTAFDRNEQPRTLKNKPKPAKIEVKEDPVLEKMREIFGDVEELPLSEIEGIFDD